MYAPDALLDHHGVPRQLVVHEHIAELEVEPFGAGACGDEDAALLALEFREPLRALSGGERSREHNRVTSMRSHMFGDERERRKVLAEDDDSVRRLVEHRVERDE